MTSMFKCVHWLWLQWIDSTFCLSSPTALRKDKSSLQMVRDLYDGVIPMMDEEELGGLSVAKFPEWNVI